MALQFDFAPDGGVQFSGNFQDLSFGKLLLWVAREKYSGELSLTSPETKPQWLFFKDGQPVGIRGGPGEHYLGWLLVESGKIDEATCMASLQEAAQQKKLQGQILKAMGVIRDNDLQYALRVQLQRKLIRVFTYRQARFVFRSQPHVSVQDVPPGDLHLYSLIGHGLRQVNDIQLLRETLREAETQSFRLKEENHFPAALEEMPLDEDQINALALLYDWTDVTHFLQTGYLEPLPALVLLAIFYVCGFFETGTKDLIRSKSLSFDDLASPDFAAHPMFAENPSPHTTKPYTPTRTATPAPMPASTIKPTATPASMPTSTIKPTATPASISPPVATPTAPRPSTYQQASTIHSPNVPSTSTTRPPNVPSTSTTRPPNVPSTSTTRPPNVPSTSTTRPPNVPSTSTTRPPTTNSELSANAPAHHATPARPLPPNTSPVTTRQQPQPKTTYSSPNPTTANKPPQSPQTTASPTTHPTRPAAPTHPATSNATSPPSAPTRPTAPPISTVAQPPPPARPAPNAASTTRSPQANASKTPDAPAAKPIHEPRSDQQSTKIRPSKAGEGDVFIDESLLSPEDLELKHTIEAKLQQAAEGANFYELLNVGRTADTKEIRESYRQLSRTFHPDRVAGSPLEPLRKKLDSFFAQLNEAHQILSRKTTREDYDRNLKTPRKQVQHVENSVKAEEMYGKATVQIRRKDFKSALEQLKWVRQISPDTGDYEADTFWCEYHLSPQKADVWQETIQKIEKTLEHEAEPDRVYFYIGEIYREQKHHKEAMEAYEKYLAVAPYSQKSDEVRQQVRILQHELKKQYEAAVAARQKAKEAKESAKKGGWGFGRK